MTTHNTRESLLGELPFHHVIELIDLLATPQNRIKCCLENNNFQGYLYQSLPEQLNSNNYASCKYYTEDEINDVITHDIPDMSILHYNIRSMNKKFSELMGLLLNIDIDFDIIALSEIGHVNCENVANLLKDTHKFACDKPSQNFGGAVKHHFHMNERIDLKLRNDSINVENVWYELKNSKTNEKIVVAVIYRHPVYTKTAYENFVRS